MFPLDNVATARCLLHLATEFLRIQHRVGYHLKVTENVSIPYTLRGFDVATGPGSPPEACLRVPPDTVRSPVV